MEYIKDYDFPIKYHPEKANVVADALSRKSVTVEPAPKSEDPEEEPVTLAHLCAEWLFIEEFHDLEVELHSLSGRVMIASMSVCELTLIQKIKDNQRNDPDFVRIF